MSGAPRLFANLGAEEGAAWTRMAAHPRVRAIARLWAALFPPSARVVAPFAEPRPGRASAAAFAFLAAGDVLVPWLATLEAAELARAQGVPLGVAPPGIALAVHDKAFAQAAAAELGLVPDALASTSLALGPDELVDAGAARARIEAAVARWPEALRARFALKPRLGTSGRGRVTGREGRLDADAFAGALERLRARGGVVVEPWLARTLDLSAQLFVASTDDVRVLGSLRQVVSTHGVPLGHAGRITRDGAIDSGTAWDAALRDAARTLGGRAARAGFTGVCGVDALVFRDARGVERLRPVVELNARFTAGTVALGHVRRALDAGALRAPAAFYLGFESPEHGAQARLALLDDEPEIALHILEGGEP